MWKCQQVCYESEHTPNRSLASVQWKGWVIHLFSRVNLSWITISMPCCLLLHHLAQVKRGNKKKEIKKTSSVTDNTSLTQEEGKDENKEKKIYFILSFFLSISLSLSLSLKFFSLELEWGSFFGRSVTFEFNGVSHPFFPSKWLSVSTFHSSQRVKRERERERERGKNRKKETCWSYLVPPRSFSSLAQHQQVFFVSPA